MWSEKGTNERATPSLISQLNAIEKNGLLSLIARREIERKVSEGQTNVIDDMTVDENVDVNINTNQILQELKRLLRGPYGLKLLIRESVVMLFGHKKRVKDLFWID